MKRTIHARRVIGAACHCGQSASLSGRWPREGARPDYSGKCFDELSQFGLVDVGYFG
ncbi:MAG: hypothetical protein ACI88S_001916, partial [Ilumatobacter sp.]